MKERKGKKREKKKEKKKKGEQKKKKKKKKGEKKKPGTLRVVSVLLKNGKRIKEFRRQPDIGL